MLTQAERYSKGVDGTPFDFRGYHVPFLYSRNGELFWFQAVRSKLTPSRKIAGLQTPDALGEMLSRDFNDGYEWFRACAIGARRAERGGWTAPDS